MPQAELPVPLVQFMQATNAHDTDTFLSLFATKGVVNDWGTLYTGHPAIRDWSKREFIGMQVTLKVTKVEHIAERISVFADVGGNGFNGPSRFTFVLQDGQIKEMRITEK